MLQKFVAGVFGLALAWPFLGFVLWLVACWLFLALARNARVNEAQAKQSADVHVTDRKQESDRMIDLR